MQAVKECISAINQSIHCPICLDNINNPILTPCNHAFCRFCIMEHFNSKAMVPCPVCKAKLSRRSLKSSTKITKISSLIADLCKAYETDTGKPFECAIKPLEILNLNDELSQQPQPLETLPEKSIHSDNQENASPVKEAIATPSPARTKTRPAVTMGTSARKQRSKKNLENSKREKALLPCQTSSNLLHSTARPSTDSYANLFALTQNLDQLEENEAIEIISQQQDKGDSATSTSVSLQRRSSARKFFTCLLGSGQKSSKSDLTDYKPNKAVKRNAIRTVPHKISKSAISHPIAMEEEDLGPATQAAIDKLNEDIHSAQNFPLKVVEDVSCDSPRNLRKRKNSQYKDSSASKKKSEPLHNSEKDLMTTCRLSGVRETVYQVAMNTPAKKVLNKLYTRSAVNDVLSSYDVNLTPTDNNKSIEDPPSCNRRTPKRRSLNQSSLSNSASQVASRKLRKKYSLGALFQTTTRTPKPLKSPGWSHVQSMKKDLVSGKPPILKIKNKNSAHLLTYKQISAKKTKSSHHSSFSKEGSSFKSKVSSLLKRNSSNSIHKCVSPTALPAESKDDSHRHKNMGEVTNIQESEPMEHSKSQKSKSKSGLHRLTDITSKLTRSKVNASAATTLTEQNSSKFKSTSDLPSSQERDDPYDTASLSMIPDTEPQSMLATQKSLSKNKHSQKSASTILTNWSKNAIRRTCSFLLPKMLSSGSSRRSIGSCLGSQLADISVSSSIRRLSDPEPCDEHLHCSTCGDTVSLDMGNFTRCTGIDLSMLENEFAHESRCSVLENGTVYDDVANDSRCSLTNNTQEYPHDFNTSVDFIPDTMVANSVQLVGPTQDALSETQIAASYRENPEVFASHCAAPSMQQEDNEDEQNCPETASSIKKKLLVEDSEEFSGSISRSNSHHSELMNTEDRLRLEDECAELEANVASLERQLEEAALSPETVQRLLSTAVDPCSFVEEDKESETKRDRGSATVSPNSSGNHCDSEPDMIPSSQDPLDTPSYPEQSQITASYNSHQSMLPPASVIPGRAGTGRPAANLPHQFSDHSTDVDDDSSWLSGRVVSRHPAASLVQAGRVNCSQTSQSSSKASISRMSITGSGLDQEEMVKLQKFCKFFNADFDARFILLKTTHVIMKVESDNKRAVQRTLKYFLGILSKAWIVDFEWIKGSLFASTLLNESNYEIEGDIACGIDTNGPSLSRNTPGFLFSNLCLCPIGRLGLLTTHDFENLVNAGAGQYVCSPDAFPLVTARRKLIIANRLDENFSIDACKELFARFRVMIVHVDWILDSVSYARRQPLEKKYQIFPPSNNLTLE